MKLLTLNVTIWISFVLCPQRMFEPKVANTTSPGRKTHILRYKIYSTWMLAFVMLFILLFAVILHIDAHYFQEII